MLVYISIKSITIKDLNRPLSLQIMVKTKKTYLLELVLGPLAGIAASPPFVLEATSLSNYFLRLLISGSIYHYECDQSFKGLYVEVGMELKHKLAEDLEASLNALASGLLAGMFHLAFQELYLNDEVGFSSSKASFSSNETSFPGAKASNLLLQLQQSVL